MVEAVDTAEAGLRAAVAGCPGSRRHVGRDRRCARHQPPGCLPAVWEGLTPSHYATATLDAWNTSAGIGWCSRQVIAIGFSPSCET